ncbi:sigma-70 family RNA polymerase sigma factor [Solirubrobacter taibaiensis]|nr:sigma-70 family RNA polymerase sigma factor [Solirubrobacter taibaiensis]
MSAADAWQAERTRWRALHQSEERRLFARLAGDRTPATRDAIVERFMPLARQLARRYRSSSDLDDLEQVAAIGLIKAIDRFDPDRGLAFSTFAFPTIVGELKRYLRDHSWSVRLPRSLQEKCVEVERATGVMTLELGRAPSVGELAERVGCTVEQTLEARAAASARSPVSLDQPRGAADGSETGGVEIAIEETGFAAAENSAALAELLRCLSDRDQRILWLRFGEDRTQSEIGEMVGLSQMHVSRLIRDAIARLQDTARRPQGHDAPRAAHPLLLDRTRRAA